MVNCKLPQAVLDAVVAHAREAAPGECCGMLLGSVDRIVDAVRARNRSGDPNRFLVDPEDHIVARRTARTRGIDLVGFYHSHPHSDAYPSASDVAETSYPDCVYLIVSLMREPAARLFRMNGDGPQELILEIESPRK
jgi:proteasome lid subunit RPN8/RPN11